jgi:hypothetical protein
MSEPGVVGRLVIPVLGALLATGLAWVVGLDAGHVVLLGLAVLLIAGAVRILGRAATTDWAGPVDESSGTGCHLVPLQARILTECEGDPERFERLLAPRLRRLAAGRLHAAGYGLGDPVVRDLLSPQVFDRLRPGHAPRRGTAYVARLLDRLDDLDPPSTQTLPTSTASTTTPRTPTRTPAAKTPTTPGEDTPG